MKKNNICFIISNLGQGGAEFQFYSLLKSINKENFKVTLVLYAYQSDSFYNLDDLKNINIIKNKLKSNFFIFKIMEALFFIRKILNQNNFDIVNSSLFMNNLFVRLASPKKYRNRIITNMRTSILNYNIFYILMERLLINNSYVVFNSNKSLETFKKYISKKFRDRLFCIYNGFIISNHENKEINFDKMVFGCLGRLSKEKNFIQPVRVFNSLGNSSFKLKIMGKKSNQYDLILNQSMKNKKINLLKESTNIDEFFSKIDFLIIPSLFEGCPNVLFEAFIRKIPCIISEKANSDFFVKNKINGFVYDGSDLDLKVTIQKIKNYDNKRIDEICKDAFNYVSQKFNISSMTSNYENLFIKIDEEN